MAEPTDPDDPDDDEGEATTNVEDPERTATGRNRKRRTQPRPKRIAVKKLTRRVLDAGWIEDGRVLDRDELPVRPKTWGECAPYVNACPFVGCRHHNFLDVNQDTGTITMNHPHREPLDLDRPCSLFVAEGGGLTLEEAGDVLNLTRERIRQIEITAQIRLKRNGRRYGIDGKI